MKVRVEGRRKLYPAIIAHHEGFDPVWVQPTIVSFTDDGEWINIIEKRYPASVDVAIFDANMPFLIIEDEKERESLSGYHKVIVETPVNVLLKLKKRAVFPKGARPSPAELNVKDPYVAWTVAEGVDTIWILEYFDVPDVKVYVKFNVAREELKGRLEALQGNLYYAKINELEKAISEPSPFKEVSKLRFYNHTIRASLMEYMFIPARAIKLTGVLFIVDAKDKLTIESSEHGKTELPEGKYIFYHPKPVEDTD